MAMHAGSAILVLCYTEILIDNCTFTHNIAGSYRGDYRALEKEGQFIMSNDEVTLNAECCKGIVSMVGKGGAIRVQRGSAIVNNSRFVNNTARQLGGSVFVDIDGSLRLLGTYFENASPSDTDALALQGDILYSDGKIVVNKVELIVKTALNGISIVRHSGDHWSLNMSNVLVKCPVGYDLRVTNSSAYGVTDFGLRRSHLLDQLSYFCESCPRNKYSLGYGYLNDTLYFSDFAYFTLYINGSKPTFASNGQYIHHKITCSNCPYGGHCVQGIAAIANFWGYVQDEYIKFQHCPPGYCCSTPKCSEITSCARGRAGVLCGRCKEGYSEALFSPICVPNSICGPVWLYPFTFAVGLVYAIFLVFQTDLKQFLFSKPIKCTTLRNRIRKTYETAYIKSRLRLRVKMRDGMSAESQFIENHKEANGTITDEHSEKHIVGDPGRSIHLSVDAISDRTDAEQQSLIDTDNGSGFLIILFYYFQDALLLHVQTVYITAESKSQKVMKNVLLGLFRFQLDLFELIEEVCVMPDLTAVPKAMGKAMMVPYVFLLFGVMYILYRWGGMLRGSTKLHSTTNQQMLNGGQKRPKTFSTRLATGFVLALLFSFQKLGTTVFTLLNCVPVQGKSVLFIDGTVTCYQNWQYGVLAYAITCVSPFCIVLMVGPAAMSRGLVSLSEFFFACICPLPMLFLWALKKVRQKKVHVRKRVTDDALAVMHVLQGPFKESMQDMCWSGMLIGRRLVLILLFTFVNDSLVRLLCMLFTCFIILLHHVHVQPYKDARGNFAGLASAAALIILGSINLVRAGFEAAEYTPTGPNEFLMKVFTEIENALMLWFPLCVVSFIGLVLLIRLGTIVSKPFYRRGAPVASSPLAANSITQTSLLEQSSPAPHSSSSHRYFRTSSEQL